MTNYPQLDNASGVWNLREVYDAVMGGYWPNARAIGLRFGATPSSTIDQIEMATAGNATFFGDLTPGQSEVNCYSSFIRGVVVGGTSGGDEMSYVTFSNQGNTADFGNLSQGRGMGGSHSNSVRGVYGGG